MDGKIEALVCIGAAVAANCVPCFEHYFGKATAMGLGPEEIRKAVELATKVKSGAQVTIRNRIEAIMAESGQAEGTTPCRAGNNPCCA